MTNQTREINNPQNCINANLRKASRAITKLYVTELADSGLQGTQFTLLSTIAGIAKMSGVGCTITQLAHYMVMDQTTVTRSVEKLRQSGYVEIVRGEDRRERIVNVTGVGQQVVDETYPQWREVQQRVWARLGDEKARQLLDLIDEVVEITQM
ncbi:MAG: MarR family winged helix-turn-helix transcriptional regulator [Chloroflexota bacterium]